MTPTQKEKATTGQLWSWALYDWANSAFFAVVQTFVFAAYFTKAVALNPVVGSSIWGYTIGAAGLVIAIAGPFLGAIADQYGQRKPWLIVFGFIGILATAALWFVKPEATFVALAVILVFLGTVGTECSIIFYNSFLPNIAPSQKTGLWSGRAAGLGYAGGLVCLLLLFFLFIHNPDPLFGLNEAHSQPIRATLVITAGWYLLFSLPVIFITPDTSPSDYSLSEAIKHGWNQLKTSFKEVKKYRDIATFLIARLLFIDGLATLFAFGGIYAASVFGFNTSEVLWFGIGLNLTAGIGAVAFGRIDDWIGSRKSMLLTLGGLIITTVILLLITAVFWFWVLGLTVGFFVGPLYATSRSYMAHIAPKKLQTQMFGFMSLSGKATAFIGPLAAGWLTAVSGSQRIGMIVIPALFLAGFLVLLRAPNLK